MSKYKMGFWNYVRTGDLDEKTAVADWKKLGMNLPISFHYDYEKHDKNALLRLLDECHANGMQVIVDDKRTNFRRYIQIGKQAFVQEVKQAVADFGTHPAVYGFYVGDEPTAKQWDSAIDAFTIVRNAAPKLTPFINFFPLFEDENFEKLLEVKLSDQDGYADKLADFIARTGAKLLCYDFYGQCGYFGREKGINLFFRNLNMYYSVAKRTGAEPFTCPLSVGHWGYRTPTDDDFRWQLAAATAHGMTGFMWFFVYERRLHENYRNAPIDEFGEKTETFARMSHEIRSFMKNIAPKLEGYELKSVRHFHKSYGNTPLFDGSGKLKSIQTYEEFNPSPMAVSHFENAEGKQIVAVVNLCVDAPTFVTLSFADDFNQNDKSLWIAPGQMTLYYPNDEK